jgi:ABC-type transport system involved in multi-copper enzyme maturation permease subunit
MIWNIARKEVLSNLLTLRFAVGMALLFFLTLLFTSILIKDYGHNLEEYNKQIAQSAKTLNQIKVYQNLRPEVHKPPEVLTLFSKGIEENVSKSARVSVFDVPVLSSSGTSKNPLLSVFSVLDVVLVFKLVVTVLALLLAYDAVSGEKETGTLGLMFSNPVPRYQLVLGKFVGGMLTLALPIVIGFLITSLIMEFSPMVKLGAAEWLRIAFMFVVSLIMVSVLFNIGLCISSMTRRAADTLMVLLLIWVVFLLVVPNASAYLATRIKPIVSRAKINAQIQDLQNRMNEEIREIRRQNPEDPNRIYIQSDDRDSSGFYMYYGTKAEVERRLILNPLIGPLRMDYAREIGEVNRQYLESLVSQKKWTEWLSRLSPISAYENLMSALARSDLSNLEHFSRSAKDYRQQLVDYFQNKKIFSSVRFFGTMKLEDVFEIKKNIEYGRALMRYADRNPEPLDLSDLPSFQDRQENVLVSLKRMLPDLLLLIGAGFLFFICAFMAILKYDVR